IPAFTTDPEFFQLLNYAINGTNSDDSTHLYTTLSIGAAIIVNLNTQNPAVIAALLKGTITAEPSGSPLALTASNNAAASPTPNPNIGIIAGATTGSEGTLHKPAVGRRDIPRLVAAAGNYISSAPEEQKETISRALGEMTQTRTWGLMIDLIAQSGALSANRKHPF